MLASGFLGVLFTSVSSAQFATTNANCDYSNASQYNGWGWNPAQGESCPPMDSLPVADSNSGLAVCTAESFDSDGDGFGWENDASCIVTSDSTSSPAVFNRETNQEVDLVRAYWDGNTDIADRLIRCDLHHYDSLRQQYTPEPSSYRVGIESSDTHPSFSFSFIHSPLPSTPPFEGSFRALNITHGPGDRRLTTSSAPVWTVNDGQYIGPTVLQSTYIEVITKSDGHRAVRNWVNIDESTGLQSTRSSDRVRTDGYYECWDEGGRDFAPSGQAGIPTASPATPADIVFTTAPNRFQHDPATIVNKETGLPVDLEFAYWNFNEDVANRDIVCDTFGFDREAMVYRAFGRNIDMRYPLKFPNRSSGVSYWSKFTGSSITPLGKIENDVMVSTDGGDLASSVLFRSQYIERIDRGVRFWTTSSGFDQCSNLNPTGSAPLVIDNNNRCDYSSSSLYNGWGWNPVTQQSCAPITDDTRPDTANNCDYSQAHSNDDWGWNNITNTSCPPVETSILATTIQTECIDTDGDGWGWNGTDSCAAPPVDNSARCVYNPDTSIYTNGVSNCSPELVEYRRSMLVRKIFSTPVIDGVVDDSYTQRRFINHQLINNTENALLGTGSFYAAHDGQYLYLVIGHEDPGVFHDSSVESLFQDDGWEIFFNSGNEAHSSFDTNDTHLIGDWGSTGSLRTLIGLNSQKDLSPAIACASSDANQWRSCEIRIPLSKLGATGPETKEIGFDVQVNGDTDGGDRDYKKAYCGPDIPDETWFNPSRLLCAMRIQH